MCLGGSELGRSLFFQPCSLENKLNQWGANRSNLDKSAPMYLPEFPVWQRIRIFQKAIPSDWQVHRSEIIMCQRLRDIRFEIPRISQALSMSYSG